jgi:hypothetical protein
MTTPPAGTRVEQSRLSYPDPRRVSSAYAVEPLSPA